ncbi:hypothetical protein NERG_01089 [Nematocida ausubeli]|uniref:Uncharacterized protein n=1 Tax=Nematocida ausubeli (strain ATCC PRA-371 / ERTm2) TaxID=1913371 RepID=H8ZCU2_NEMA1|nr:hypothetical protein NERG_01089 [Nematocida ausubeli]
MQKQALPEYAWIICRLDHIKASPTKSSPIKNASTVIAARPRSFVHLPCMHVPFHPHGVPSRNDFSGSATDFPFLFTHFMAHPLYPGSAEIIEYLSPARTHCLSLFVHRPLAQNPAEHLFLF